MLAASAEIAKKATRAGKIACTLAANAEGGRRARELGFRLIALGNDFIYLSAARTRRRRQQGLTRRLNSALVAPAAGARLLRRKGRRRRAAADAAQDAEARSAARTR